ncbi:hypothetical protein GN956_G7701 [Arapaima gigas]
MDIIVPFWVDIDNRRNGTISYRQVTNGSDLQRATSTETSFQVVLVADGSRSFVLMNYGRISPQYSRWQVGYDTGDSQYYFSVPSNPTTELTFSSNVNVTGCWAFETDLSCANGKAQKSSFL